MIVQTFLKRSCDALALAVLVFVVLPRQTRSQGSGLESILFVEDPPPPSGLGNAAPPISSSQPSTAPAGEPSAGAPSATLPQVSLSGNLGPVTQLAPGQSITGRVGKGESDYFRFGGNGVDFLLALTPYTGGDADLYCVPAVASVVPPGPVYNAWSSDFSEGQDFIFISRNDSAFDSAINSTGVADFVCAVYGWSTAGVQYRLVLDTDARARSLVPLEQDAIAGLFNRCCAGEQTCLAWKEVNAQASQPVYTDFCNFGANICDDNAFSNLRKLSLQKNAFWGNISLVGNALDNLTFLETVDLSYNNLTGSMPDGSGFCSMVGRSLKLMNVEFNNIEGQIPECLLGLGSQLREFLGAFNSFSGQLPDVIPTTSFLDSIDLAFNNLSGPIPPSLGNAYNLATISLGLNNLTGTLPKELGSLPNLVSLRLAGNGLQGSVPMSVGKSSSLVEITLNSNYFDSLPDGWYLQTAGVSGALRYVDVGSNNITGPFPQGLLLSPNITILYVDDNQIRGKLPDVPVIFPQGRMFNASSNYLYGTIPEGLSQSAIFEGLRPNISIDSLALRHMLDLSNNNLTGAVPMFLYESNLPKRPMPSIFLGGNPFNCPVPEDLQYIPNITCGVPLPAPPTGGPPPASNSSLSADLPYGTTRTAGTHHHSGLSGGAIFGIVLASLIGVALAAYAGVYLYRRHSQRGQGWEKHALDGGNTAFFSGRPGDVEIPPARAGF